MKRPGHFRLFRTLWFRITLATSAVLVVTLAVVVVAVYELTLTSERNDLDEVLTREGTVIAQSIVDDLERYDSSADTDMLPPEKLREFASRALATHPGSALHIALVRWGDEALSSARGPERLTNLRDGGMLPRPSAGVLESVNGIRSRSQIVRVFDLVVTVETLGDDAAISGDARDVAKRTLLAASIGGLIGLLALSLVVRRLTRLITTVSSTVRATQLENIPRRIADDGGSHEVAVLARDFNKMLDDLAVARASSNELIASVSHEIRTPLAAARGHTDLLLENRATDPHLTVSRIDRELGRMTRLVDDLLALSRSSDPSWLSLELVHVQSILDDLSDRSIALGAKNIKIGSAPDVVIEVDSDRILQALSNLVRNSVLHTPDGTLISVATRIEGASIDFIVNDNGPGIGGEILERFGEAFVRGSETGTGLGLAVSRAVAMAHGGTLGVNSSSEGTSVSLSIPIERQTAAPPSAQRV